MRGMMTGVANKFKSGPSTTAFYNSFLYDAQTKYVSIADNASLDVTTNMSVSMWINPASLPVQAAGLMSRWIGGQRSFTSLVLATGQIEFSISTNGTAEQFIDSVGTVSTSTLTHLLLTYDGSNQRIYINGALDSTKAATGSLFASTDPIIIGSLLTSSFPFDGDMTQPILFNTTLDLADAIMLCNIGKPLKYSKIDTAITDDAVMAFEMNSNDNSLTDLSSNSNDGTANGGVTSDGGLIEWDIL